MVVQPLVNLLYTNCLPANEYSIVLTDNKGEGEGESEGEGTQMYCSLSCRKVYHSLRHLERNLAVNSIGENVILGRVDQLVGHSGLCKCACIAVVCGNQIGNLQLIKMFVNGGLGNCEWQVCIWVQYSWNEIQPSIYAYSVCVYGFLK